MKGDVSVCCASRFQINVRCATLSSSPFSMKCETHLYYACLPYEEMRDMCNRGTSHIRSPCPKISGPVLSLAISSNFLKPPSALALLSPKTLPSWPWTTPLPHPRPQSTPPPRPRPRSTLPPHPWLRVCHR
jgi:hypothetical protein